MRPDDFDGILVALRGRSPFQPFTIELVGGHRFEVDLDTALVVRDGVAVFLMAGGVPVWFDHESVTRIAGDNINSPES